MSYDFSFMNKTENGIEDITDELENGYLNITFNVAPMFKRAFKVEKGIKLLNGLSVEDSLVLITTAILNMIRDRKEMKKLNPINGWGSYEGTLRFLVDFAIACQEAVDLGYEDAYIEVSY